MLRAAIQVRKGKALVQSTLTQFFDIRKVDEEARMVWGYASTEAVDCQGEVITKDAMKAAWTDYMKFANVREMHQPSAVGLVKEYEFDDVGVMIGAYIVDDNAWKKVVEKVYKGFSVGGKKLPGGYDPATKIISALALSEISLVDRPANPEALVTMWKADNLESFMNPDENTPVDKLAELLTKGVITPERLLQLIDADVNKVAEPVVPATVEKAAIQKSFSLLSATGDEVKKGLYTLSWFADLLQSLAWLQNECAWEAEYEEDASPLPVQLASAVANLSTLLLAMAKEEVEELVESLKLPDDMDALSIMTALVANCDTAKDLTKFSEIRNVLKAGSRNSSADQELIQKAHDALNELGAVCKAAEPDVDDTAAKLAKAAETGSIAKALGDFEKMAGELGSLRKSFDTLQGDHATLQKKFDEMPVPSKGVLKTVGKGDDVADTINKADVDTVYKSDGTEDTLATAIKKVHANRV
jgi:hypothetical protein